MLWQTPPITNGNTTFKLFVCASEQIVDPLAEESHVFINKNNSFAEEKIQKFQFVQEFDWWKQTKREKGKMHVQFKN